MDAELARFICLVILLLVVAVFAIYNLSVNGRRQKRLRAWARSVGLSFDPSKDKGFRVLFCNFDCLRKGDSDRYAYNVMKGQRAGRPILFFDYHVETSEHKYNFSAVIVTSSIPLKPLCIRRESFFDKFAEFVGFDDINFESAQFSRKFHVKSPDKRWASDVIHPRMMEYLLNAPDFGIQFGYKHVIAWHRFKFKPATFEAAAELISGILDRLPEYVVRQQSQ